MTEHEAELAIMCDARWQYFSMWIFEDFLDFFNDMLLDFVENPLCVAITSILLVVAGFAILRRIIITVSSRG